MGRGFADGAVGVGRSRGRWRSRRTSDRGRMVARSRRWDARALLASPGERPCARRRRARRRRLRRARERAPFPRNDAPRAPENPSSDQLRLERRPPRLWRPRRRDAPPARRRASRTAPPGAPSAPSAPRCAASPAPLSRPARRVVRETQGGSTRRVRPGKRDRSDVFDSVSISTVRPRNSPSRESNDFRPSRETYGTRQRARAPPAAP